MTRWLQAATQGLCQTDRTDRTDGTPDAQAIMPSEPASLEVPSVLSVRQFDTEPVHEVPPPAQSSRREAAPNSVGHVIQWTGRGFPPDAIRQGVTEAFEDWEAMNDPHDPRAWA